VFVPGVDIGKFGLSSQQVQDYSHRSKTRKRADDGRQRLPETNGRRSDRTAAETWSAVTGCRQYVTAVVTFCRIRIVVRAETED